MRNDVFLACNLQAGMVIVPPVRTMRHAVVKSIKYQDDFQSSQTSFDHIVAPKVPDDMRNHGTSYVVVNTDIGLRSYRWDDSVKVMVSES